MRVDVLPKALGTQFKDLAPGDVFRFRAASCIFMVTAGRQAVRLTDGFTYCEESMLPWDEVERVTGAFTEGI